MNLQDTSISFWCMHGLGVKGWGYKPFKKCIVSFYVIIGPEVTFHLQILFSLKQQPV